ncbi:YggT family protein [Mariniluteicoccus endophyticus]
MVLTGTIIYYALSIYLFVLIARMIMSWIPLFSPGWQPKGPLLVMAELIYTLTDPPLKALQRVIPPVRMGGVMLDVGFMALWFIVILLQWVTTQVFLR